MQYFIDNNKINLPILYCRGHWGVAVAGVLVLYEMCECAEGDVRCFFWPLHISPLLAQLTTGNDDGNCVRLGNSPPFTAAACFYPRTIPTLAQFTPHAQCTHTFSVTLEFCAALCSTLGLCVQCVLSSLRAGRIFGRFCDCRRTACCGAAFRCSMATVGDEWNARWLNGSSVSGIGGVLVELGGFFVFMCF